MATCKALLKCEAKPEENDIGTKRIERVYCGWVWVHFEKQSEMKPTNKNTYPTDTRTMKSKKNRNKYIILFMVCAFWNCQWCIPTDKVPHVVCA